MFPNFASLTPPKAKPQQKAGNAHLNVFSRILFRDGFDPGPQSLIDCVGITQCPAFAHRAQQYSFCLSVWNVVNAPVRCAILPTVRPPIFNGMTAVAPQNIGHVFIVHGLYYPLSH
ncbi:hypothetical protein Tbd_2817 [Thiobacillus denitrificans ATCC 25259]|uniref:Uncharacterized protein n=1 Tax=Thiobacillus denitrificans (strain ATCC 25259 / T1) TaxID=292415 RepID=Q3SF46_THIDA|nr:hypothetical protein Tbd_2817 [Thiobacillus denitrificans ATCC 25259]